MRDAQRLPTPCLPVSLASCVCTPPLTACVCCPLFLSCADEVAEFQASTGALNAEFSFSELSKREHEVFDLFL